jgi:hypothetical protein
LEIRKDAPESQEEYFLLIAGQLRELFRTNGNT